MNTTEQHDYNLKVTVNIPVTKEVFEAWEQLDGYQDYLLEDFDMFIYLALCKSFSRHQVNQYIKTAIKVAQDSIEEANQEV
jgi:hypothetical protein